ncbi:MAG: transglutaminaseTgpA domain-containing protein, partial [bacterium]|nr:transglutaminaseTgpA domain-containing protein [bacterium]
MTDHRGARQGRLARRDRARWDLVRWRLAREIAGPALTAATAFSLIRVFDGRSWILPVLIAAATSHLLALAVRRIGWSMPVSTLVSGVGLLLTVTWTHYWHTTAWGMPVAETLAALADDFEAAWTAFGDLSPPVAPLNGFTVTAMVVTWLIAFLLDDCWAMRHRALSESMLLPIAAIGFVGLVGDHQHRILTIGVFTAALLYFAVIHRVAARTAGIPWLGGRGRASAGRRSLLIAGAAMAAFALGGALAAVPVLSSDDSPLVDLAVERRRESSTRVVISPLVDIRGRLVNQADTAMFQVRAEERSYWRLTSLDRFDGQVWTSQAEYASRPTQLPSLLQSGSSVEESVQQFTIEQLSAVWLPAAFEPRSLALTSDEIALGDISYEPSSSTLIVGRSLATADGLS